MAQIPSDLTGLRTGDLTSDVIRALRVEAVNNLYLFGKAILGYRDLTVRTHKGFCDWMQAPAKRKLGLMPRGHFKTTIDIADILRRLIINPNERILLVNESSENAETMLGEIKGHIFGNQILRTVFPQLIPPDFNATTWTRDKILLPRPGNFRESSVEAAGVTTRIVSRHFTLIKGDDLISDEAMFSPTVMKKAIKFVNRLVSLLTHPLNDEIHLIGTRWAFTDVYSHVIENMPSYDVFIRKAIVLGPDGPEPFFPERYSMEIFQDIIENDPDQWATQYANDPLDTSVADLRPEWLQYCTVGPDKGLRWTDDDGMLQLTPWSDLRFYMHYDPSVGDEPRLDYGGITVVGINPAGQKFLVDAVKVHVDPLQQVNKLLDLCQTYHPKRVTFESNAFQKSLAYFIPEEAKKRMMYVPLEAIPASSHKTKRARVLGALQPLFSGRTIWVRRGLVDFVNEYLHYGKSEHEHLLDSLAQGPPIWRVPLSENARRRIAKRRARAHANLGVTGYGA